MAITYKVLGQLLPTAATLSTLYTVPNSTQSVASTLCVCNQSSTASFRVAVRPSGAAVEAKHYIAYDSIVQANDTVFLTLGFTLSSTDVVSVYSSSGTVSFTLFGSESM